MVDVVRRNTGLQNLVYKASLISSTLYDQHLSALSSWAIKNLAPAIHFLVSEVPLFFQAARDALMCCTRYNFSVQ